MPRYKGTGGGGGGAVDPSNPDGWPEFILVGTNPTLSAAGTYSLQISPSDAPTVNVAAGLVIDSAYVAQPFDVNGAEIRLNGANAVRLSGDAGAKLPVPAWVGVPLGGTANFTFEPGATSTKKAWIGFTLVSA